MRDLTAFPGRGVRAPWPVGLVLCALLAGPATHGANPLKLGTWTEVETDDLLVLSNANKAQTLEVIDLLNRLRLVLLQLTGDPAFRPPLPVYLYVFRDEHGFKPFKRADDGRPTTAAGYFVETANAHYLAMNRAAGKGIGSHELVHSLLRFRRSNLPLAVEEGLARYYGSFESERGWAQVGKPQAHLARGLSRALMLPLGELLAIEEPSYDHNSVDYRRATEQAAFTAESWGLVHMLLSREGGRRQMERYLARLGAGEEPVAALEATYRSDAATLEAELDAYLRAGEFHYTEFRFRERPELPEHRFRKLHRSEALARLAELLARRRPVRFELARKYAADALVAGPDRALPHLTLGYLAALEGRPDEAEREYRRALDLGGGDPGVLARVGGFLLDRAGARAAHGGGIPRLEQARSLLRKSLRLSPDDPRALAALGGSFLVGGDPAEGIAPLSAALQKLPGDTVILRDLIVLTARSGNVAGARSLLEHSLEPLADRETLDAVIAEIDLAERRSPKTAPD